MPPINPAVAADWLMAIFRASSTSLLNQGCPLTVSERADACRVVAAGVRSLALSPSRRCFATVGVSPALEVKKRTGLGDPATSALPFHSHVPSRSPNATAPPTPLKATLRIHGGPSFEGQSFGADTSVTGEAVFTTSMVGYPESMTDPSYAGQILVFTQPLVGNYGVPSAVVDRFGLLTNFESPKIHLSGIVVSDYSTSHSHWKAVCSLGDWCKSHNVPAITGVDTRAIVHALRQNGSSPASLVVGEDVSFSAEYVDPNSYNVVATVSVKYPVVYNRGGDVRIGLVDCGVKQNIIRCLALGGAEVVLLPWDYDFSKSIDTFDGIFISNGPGDPRHCGVTVDHLRRAIEIWDKPIFGICMGNLLLGMAAGLKAKKLRFGNRGHNQPAINQVTGKCVITSQNHGYALDDREMPPGWERYFVNANDGSNEGIRHLTKPFFSVQFHPEARGGPRDCEALFDSFLATVRDHKKKSSSSSLSPNLLAGTKTGSDQLLTSA